MPDVELYAVDAQRQMDLALELYGVESQHFHFSVEVFGICIQVEPAGPFVIGTGAKGHDRYGPLVICG